MSTETPTRPLLAPRSDLHLVRSVAVVTLSPADIDSWLRDDEPRLRALADRSRLRAAQLDELRTARAQLDRAVAVLDRLTLTAEADGGSDADLDTIGWLHTRSSALADTLTAAVERRALDRAA